MSIAELKLDHKITRPASFSYPAILIAAAVLHAPLAVAMREIEGLADAHRLLAVAVAAWCAFLGKSLERALIAGVYVVSAEVLWRMAGIVTIWEFSKYVSVVVFAACLGRFFRRRIGVAGPVSYVALLIPGGLLTITSLDTSTARSEIAFNLLGPLLLAVTTGVFRQVPLPWRTVRGIIWCVLGPSIGVATLALTSTLEAGLIMFTGESNFTTSGGFGPNQVSTALSFGALCSIWLAIEERQLVSRLAALAVALWFIVQDLLTFSRSGIYALTFALFGASCYLLRHRRHRLQVAILLSAFVVVILGVIMPKLEAFTSNNLGTRLADTEAGGRSELARADIQTWQRNFFIGAGVGMSKFYRAGPLEGQAEIAAHTEGTRLLAEHGLLGLLAFLLLVGMLVRALRQQPQIHLRAWIVAFGIWSMATMMASAMRTASIALAFGLATMNRASEGDG